MEKDQSKPSADGNPASISERFTNASQTNPAPDVDALIDRVIRLALSASQKDAAVAELESLESSTDTLETALDRAEKFIAYLSDRYAGVAHERALRTLRRRAWFMVRKRRVNRQAYALVDNSALFDRRFYLDFNPDVAAAGIDPVVHYLRYGSKDGRNPSPFLSEKDYRAAHPDVAGSGLSAVEHYETYGRKEGRRLFSQSSERTAAERRDVSEGPEAPIPPRAAPPSRWKRRLRGLLGGRRRKQTPLSQSAMAAESRRKFRVRVLPGAMKAPSLGARPLVLYVTHVPPWPIRAGNEYGVQRMIAWLERRGFDVALLYSPLPGEEPDDARLQSLVDHCSNFVWISRDNVVRHGAARADVARALAELDGEDDRLDEQPGLDSRWADTLRTFCPDGLVKVAQRLDAALAPQIVIANYIFMSRTLRLIRRDAIKAIQTHDVFSSLAEKVVGFGISHGLAMTPEEEGEMLAPADLVLAVQPQEADELRRIASGSKVLLVGVDMDVVSGASTAERPIVLLIGSSNAMNVKGLLDFLRFSWPRVSSVVADAELRVAGSLGRAIPFGVEGVRALGFLDDLASAYAEARVVINPAVAGTGIKIKTLEALAHLRPQVTWPSGVDGLPPELRELCEVVTDWHAFTEAVIRLLNDPAAARRVADARATVARALSADTVFAELSSELDARLRRHTIDRNVA